MKFPGKRARASVLIGILALIGLLVPVFDQFLFRYGWASAALGDIETRYARMLGLQQAASAIDKALAESRAQLARHAYPAGNGADRVGADLQQRVRKLGEVAGLSVVGSQIMPARPGEGFEVIPLGATIDADMGSLRDFLVALIAEQPSIQVDTLAITVPRQRGRADDGKIRVQIQLSAIHLLP